MDVQRWNAVLARVTGNLTLHDVARDRRVLISHDTLRSGILGYKPGDAREKDLSWLDWSGVRDISADGSWFAFVESGEGGGPGYSAYSRRMDGSPPVRLGEGRVDRHLVRTRRIGEPARAQDRQVERRLHGRRQ